MHIGINLMHICTKMVPLLKAQALQVILTIINGQDIVLHLT